MIKEMAIPETQLETWAKQGAVTTSSNVYQSIRTALSSDKSLIKDRIGNKTVSVYLQGSYGNDTNIYADSDVDVVVHLHNTWSRDISLLSPDEQTRYKASYIDATYQWSHFHADVLASLRGYYGPGAVEVRKKVLAVKLPSYHITADVLPAIEYRKYYQFISDGDNKKIEGVQFHIPQENNRAVVNYPRLHKYYGTTKNDETDGMYKPTVRVFKNARNCLIERGIIADNLMPSYFLECMLSNVPNECFDSTHQQTFFKILKYLNDANIENFQCQNKMLPLIGTTPEQLRSENLVKFRQEIIGLWNGW